MIDVPQAVRWSEDGRAVEIIDQRALPGREVTLRLENAGQVAHAIRTMAVRGAPAIGIAAAMGFALELAASAKQAGDANSRDFHATLKHTAEILRATRPTAVNLFWAIDRVLETAEANRDRTPGEIACKVYGAATEILEEDRAMCRAIGEHAQALIPDNARVLTHCNAGALATGGIGTALAGIYVAQERGKKVKVYSDETRPLLQGSRLTVWELQKAGVDVTLIPDVVAGSLMKRGEIDLVIVGADRIAANGDVANKIGTYSLAVLANHHGIPFYVAAPSSTLDAATKTGDDIQIEERDAEEVRRGFGSLTAPADAKVLSPAFDVTPAALITAIITEKGIARHSSD